jgi:predicted nucleic acid-binding protein
MTLFFPDLNVWLALSVASHSHCPKAWRWLDLLPDDARLIFSRYTQIGLLRLLTNRAAMSQQTLTLRQAWGAYDRWLKDPRSSSIRNPAVSMLRSAGQRKRPQRNRRPSGLATAACWHIRRKAKLLWSPSTPRY